MAISAKDLVTPLWSMSLKLTPAVFTILAIWLDVVVLHTRLLELSVTEVSQEFLLIVCAVMFLTAPAPLERRGLNYLSAGFFGCLLMRELDGLLDPLGHSTWCVPFTIVGMSALYMSLKPAYRQGTLPALVSFARTPSFATLSTGFGVLMFSRVFGMGVLWHQILGPGYSRLAKTAVEEGLELLSYGFWCTAAIEWRMYQIQHTEPIYSNASIDLNPVDDIPVR